MPYEVTIERHFDAAHYLKGYKGKCENMHGHRYAIVVKVSANKLNDIGLAYDFADLKKHLGEILDRYDHNCLNDIPPFDKINPSTENLATTIYKELKESLGAARDKKLSKEPVKLTSVSAFESHDQGVEYRP